MSESRDLHPTPSSLDVLKKSPSLTIGALLLLTASALRLASSIDRHEKITSVAESADLVVQEKAKYQLPQPNVSLAKMDEAHERLLRVAEGIDELLHINGIVHEDCDRVFDCDPSEYPFVEESALEPVCEVDGQN